MSFKSYYFLLCTLLIGSCNAQSNVQNQSIETAVNNSRIIVGAERELDYFQFLKGKRVGLVGNQTTEVNGEHLVDRWLANEINLKVIFAPEHGFRGAADAGAHVKNEIDTKTGLKIISLYGKNKKPSAESLKDLDILVFDIQDVGARFYTYISTLHYVMEACADNNLPLLILDRPNPNGMWVDGPVLDTAYKSFVGMHPVPVMHGMTIGEYARMIEGEGWLKTTHVLKYEVIPCLNYEHSMKYHIPVAPSPNLRTDKAIEWYASLCFFEGTPVSVGRGTDDPFCLIGAPWFTEGKVNFMPKSMTGATLPPFVNQQCKGFNACENEKKAGLDLSYLIAFYKNYKIDKPFFSDFFDKLAGGKDLRLLIEKGKSEKEIKATWQSDLHKFKKIRKKYLIYKD